jgi:tRNA-dihydrouridine synthase C
VSEVRKALPRAIPVSAKLRLGWDNIDSIYENAENAAVGGASWITIHGRTKEQGYRPPAYWEPIGKVKKMLNIPVVANGEIWTLEDFKRCRDQTECDHFMIGRGALANPLLPRQIAYELGLVSDYENISLSSFESWQPWIKGIIRCSEGYPYPNSQYMVRRIKQWLNMAHSRGAIQWFDQVKRFQSIEEFTLGY